MTKIKLYDCLPSRNIDISQLLLGWRAFTKVYVKKGTLLYNIKYNGYKPFSIEYTAPQDGFYVHNGQCLQHAQLFDWGHTNQEPILCEFWDTKEEFENSTPVKLTPPKYGVNYNSEPIYTRSKPEPKPDVNSDPCYTYLMKDETTGYYKIGMSKDPTFREKTLLGDRPTITLLCKKSFPTRKDARYHENILHQRYKHQNTRGEWFCLSEEDVMNIRYYLE